jgi:magnesium-protoporphyrin O-methyltransferase
MTCCSAPACERQFGRKRVEREQRDYWAHGPIPTTSALIHELTRAGVKDATLLDIGGGLGAIQFELLKAGGRAATSVEASPTFLEAARAEAEREGLAERIRFESGDFVQLAARIPAADIVTLDRVVCCYPNMDMLVRLSAERSRRLYGLVYPRDRWITRAVVMVENFFRRLVGNPFRSYVHSVTAMDSLIRSTGFELQQRLRTFKWEVVVYKRAASSTL